MHDSPDTLRSALTKHPNLTNAVVVGLTTGLSVEFHYAIILVDPDTAQDAIFWINDQLAEQQRIWGFPAWPAGVFPLTHTFRVKKHIMIDTIH